MTSNHETWQDMVQSRMSRRNFLRGLGILSAGVAVQSSLPEGKAQAATTTSASTANPTPASGAGLQGQIPFVPIDPTSADELVVARGFHTQVLLKRGDEFSSDGLVFGDNCDWLGFFPIDGLEGGNSTTEGILTVNHEYLNPLFVSQYDGGDKTLDQVNQEKAVIGVSHVHVRREGDEWVVVMDSEYAARYDGFAEIDLSGPVAGTDAVNGATTVIGTFANCSGGQTPWLTNISCEENYQLYYGEDKNSPESVFGWAAAGANDEGQIPEHYGWVVETDPYTGRAAKRTALGRIRHENVSPAISNSGRLVLYMGDDSSDECVYKFVTANPVADNREDNWGLLDEGTLYVADFGGGRWIPIEWEGNEDVLGDPANVGGYELSSQADVLTYCAQAARALGGTRTDRPEDIEIHPQTGDVYIAFTNNSRHGNYHGQITRIMEDGNDPEATSFNWDIFAVGGPQSGFSSPDNMAFDTHGNLWVVTDISTSALNRGIYEFHGNNALFLFVTDPLSEHYGQAYRFASGPVDSEMTGPAFVGTDTLFLSVQHPGELSESRDNPTSTWPDGDEPRASVVVITGPFRNNGPFDNYPIFDARQA